MNIPIVTLDKIYVTPDEENIFFLDCTRVDGCNKIIARNEEMLEDQIKRISQVVSSQIILADDVVFSGTVINDIINRFAKQNIQVVGLISSICMSKAYENFNKKLKYGVKTNYLMADDVIDEVCERDFYFGIAGSGIMVETNKGYFKAPYFKPYGSPYERASIPEEYANYFSKGCLERSIYLWQEIDKLQKMQTRINQLPERIINTKPNDEVVKVLKREMKRL